jgi:serine/threonine protein kinase
MIFWDTLGGIPSRKGRWYLYGIYLFIDSYVLGFSIVFSKAREIACGLKYLHEMEVFNDDGENGIVHGDLKVVCVRIVLASCII